MNLIIMQINLFRHDHDRLLLTHHGPAIMYLRGKNGRIIDDDTMMAELMGCSAHNI